MVRLKRVRETTKTQKEKRSRTRNSKRRRKKERERYKILLEERKRVPSIAQSPFHNQVLLISKQRVAFLSANFNNSGAGGEGREFGFNWKQLCFRVGEKEMSWETL